VKSVAPPIHRARFAVELRSDHVRRLVADAKRRGFPAAQVFSPPRAQFVCFEPMTAPTNTLRSGRGLRRVAPGEEFEATFRIGVA
jgi:aldose 1-epimerase